MILWINQEIWFSTTMLTTGSCQTLRTRLTTTTHMETCTMQLQETTTTTTRTCTTTIQRQEPQQWLTAKPTSHQQLQQNQRPREMAVILRRIKKPRKIQTKRKLDMWLKNQIHN